VTVDGMGMRDVRREKTRAVREGRMLTRASAVHISEMAARHHRSQSTPRTAPVPPPFDTSSPPVSPRHAWVAPAAPAATPRSNSLQALSMYLTGRQSSTASRLSQHSVISPRSQAAFRTESRASTFTRNHRASSHRDIGSSGDEGETWGDELDDDALAEPSRATSDAAAVRRPHRGRGVKAAPPPPDPRPPFTVPPITAPPNLKVELVDEIALRTLDSSDHIRILDGWITNPRAASHPTLPPGATTLSAASLPSQSHLSVNGSHRSLSLRTPSPVPDVPLSIRQPLNPSTRPAPGTPTAADSTTISRAPTPGTPSAQHRWGRYVCVSATFFFFVLSFSLSLSFFLFLLVVSTFCFAHHLTLHPASSCVFFFQRSICGPIVLECRSEPVADPLAPAAWHATPPPAIVSESARHTMLSALHADLHRRQVEAATLNAVAVAYARSTISEFEQVVSATVPDASSSPRAVPMLHHSATQPYVPRPPSSGQGGLTYPGRSDRASSAHVRAATVQGTASLGSTLAISSVARGSPSYPGPSVAGLRQANAADAGSESSGSPTRSSTATGVYESEPEPYSMSDPITGSPRHTVLASTPAFAPVPPPALTATKPSLVPRLVLPTAPPRVDSASRLAAPRAPLVDMPLAHTNPVATVAPNPPSAPVSVTAAAAAAAAHPLPPKPVTTWSERRRTPTPTFNAPIFSVLSSQAVSASIVTAPQDQIRSATSFAPHPPRQPLASTTHVTTASHTARVTRTRPQSSSNLYTTSASLSAKPLGAMTLPMPATGTSTGTGSLGNAPGGPAAAGDRWRPTSVPLAHAGSEVVAPKTLVRPTASPHQLPLRPTGVPAAGITTRTGEADHDHSYATDDHIGGAGKVRVDSDAEEEYAAEYDDEDVNEEPDEYLFEEDDFESGAALDAMLDEEELGMATVERPWTQLGNRDRGDQRSPRFQRFDHDDDDDDIDDDIVDEVR
jgi:hypothetical protein